MKVFIVFLAMLFLSVSFLTYQEDMGRYIQTQTDLKALVEECAAGASLYYEEESYSEGKLIFRYDECRKYTEATMERFQETMYFSRESSFQYTIDYEDDFYEPCEKPAVIVEIKVDTSDFFRLPFLTVNQVTRKSRYEWTPEKRL